MTNKEASPLPQLDTPETPKYSKEIQELKLILDLEQFSDSLLFTIINNQKMVPVLFASEFSFEEIKKKEESLSGFKSINKIYTFFTKLLEKNKFKIEEKENLYILKFCYEDKLEDIEIGFEINKKEIDVKEENKNLSNYINEIKDDLDKLKNLPNVLEDEKIKTKNLQNDVEKLKILPNVLEDEKIKTKNLQDDVEKLKKLSDIYVEEKKEEKPSYINKNNDKKILIEIIKEENHLCIKIVDYSGIVDSVYVLNITLEELKERNNYFSTIKDYDRLIELLKQIFDGNKYKINKKEKDSYDLTIYFSNGIDEEELKFNAPKEKINLIKEDKKIHNTLSSLQSEIEENKSKINNIENFNSQIIDKVKTECKRYFLDLCWPVGSYYWTNNNKSPQDIFGGQWEKIEGRFLYAADYKRTVNSTGGQERVTLSINEIPSHNHNSADGNSFLTFNFGLQFSSSSGACWLSPYKKDGNMYSQTAYTGGGNSHENMPPYIAAYCWRRVK